MFAYVWGWHHSAAAALLPGADGFGWFYKYLTFWGLTMQLVSFVVSTVQLLVPVKVRPHQAPLGRSNNRQRARSSRPHHWQIAAA